MITHVHAGKKPARRKRHGHLVVIGGSEDREGSKQVLSRFVELSGGPRARIAVMTAASMEPDALWRAYSNAFTELGVRECMQVQVASRDEANDPDRIARVERSDGVFLTGGDQKRLLALIGGTGMDFAMHTGLKQRGLCIGGTSAGASAMSEHMLAEGSADRHPHKGMALLAAGLGFMPRVVIDQHFSERRRLSRLLAVVAQNPYLLGIGIDEDTALIVEPDVGIEVVGEGAVTLIDGSQMISNFLEVDQDEHLELINVRLHLLPAGGRYPVQNDERHQEQGRLAPALAEAVAIIGVVT